MVKPSTEFIVVPNKFRRAKIVSGAIQGITERSDSTQFVLNIVNENKQKFTVFGVIEGFKGSFEVKNGFKKLRGRNVAIGSVDLETQPNGHGRKHLYIQLILMDGRTLTAHILDGRTSITFHSHNREYRWFIN